MPIDMSRSRPRVQRTRPLPTVPKLGSPLNAVKSPVMATFVITDYIIIALSKNATLVREFPEFEIKVPQVAKRGCGKCGKSSPMVMRSDPGALNKEIGRIRQTLINMTQANKDRFRRLIERGPTDPIEIFVPHPQGGSKQPF